MIATLSCGEVAEPVSPYRHQFSEFADSHVVYRAQHGDSPATQFLLSKYRDIVWNKAHSYFLIGAESEDLVQVGMIGLWHAIVDFKIERSLSFRAFAKICIANHMISAIQSAARFKQTPLNSSLSLDSAPNCHSADLTLSDVLTSAQHASPEVTLIEREDTRVLRSRLAELLSDFERNVLSAYKVGKSYKEIALELSCNTKSIDNALTRIKHKVSDLPLGLADLSSVL